MTRQINNPRNTQQMDEATLANIRDLLANIRDQLAQLANRMDASEARAEMQMLTTQLRNLSVQQSNPSLQRTIPSLLQTNLDLQQKMQNPNLSLQRTNPSLEQWNIALQQQRNMAQAQQRRRAALRINQDRRAQNTITLHGHRLMATATPGRLAPLVSLSTEREIEGFPATFDDIAQINGKILAALEVATDGLSTAEMRDKIRSQVHYG
ncbi:hypothetical protein M431DRAFT_7177 [Trichoderma harzianum CBS 226.95]|uniref:Uncharacterized protein n=1 Tax=Trichoderma harzianum CBS 226.95 TaxID=983964 RepID=A0A2T4A6E4_TRIHA|nr:hypothetical protein M431DRAFT_7177 [Trichoderma harzianum CBS 226.95]PTB52652.1 hypothetical protein M431DRAFT_7177 [Trichoderma harzianum CBS 226.95]